MLDPKGLEAVRHFMDLFIEGGIGSYYCHDCYLKVQPLPVSPKQETNASKGGQSE